MKKILYYVFIALILISSSCDKIDNYEIPKEILQGKLIDEKTGESFITEQPNGFRIMMKEISYKDNPQPEYFWGKADGTFYNKRIFKGKYEITPIEGAFFPVEKKTLDIDGNATVDFIVTPYLSISELSVKTINDQTIEVSYRLSRNKVGDKIIDTRVFVSQNPNVGANIFDNKKSPIINLNATSDVDILKTTFRQTISNLEKGTTYYLRVGARTNNLQKRYNFTKIIEHKN